MTRDEAWAIVCEYVKSESLRKHMLAVEACMREYARHYGEDEEQWATVAVLHDFDFEIHPTLDEHPMGGAPILRARGVPEDIIYSVLSHADHLQEQYPRRSQREHALVACDELSGLCTAVALVRPSKSIFDVDVSAVKKKWKDKAFARGVNRQEIERYTAELGVPVDEHITRVLKALQDNADILGIRGNSAWVSHKS
ncbi:MAG: HDIG domain-containing protein [Chloroflexi bacterium]|nr:MAG: HDIG domain-containing protein [Chloroflexota bacterium]